MDFGSSIYKAKPGLKSYLFVSEYFNVLDELMSRSLLSDYVNHLSHPFTSSDFDMVMGVSEDSQAIVIDSNGLSAHEQDLITNLLSRPKMKNLSVYLVGQDSLSNDLRSKISKQGLFIEATDPNTQLSQKHASEWFGEEAKIHVSDAYTVAQSLDWNLGDILWTIKSYQAVSRDRVLPRAIAQKILNVVCFDDLVNSVFNLIVSKKRTEAFAIVKSLDKDQAQVLILRLREFLEGISLVSEAVKTESSDKKIAAVSGRNVLEVEFLNPFLHKYTFTTITKCNKLLDFAQDHIEEPEILETVVLLWAS